MNLTVISLLVFFDVRWSNYLNCSENEYGDEQYWYLGRTQCDRANAAFSLYGILQDGETHDTSSNCNKYTYINSFFTNYGVETLAEPLGIDTTYTNSQCTSAYNGNNYTSVTTGCSTSGTFVMAQYTGAYCNGRNYQATLDGFSDFNDAIESQSCVKAYDYGEQGSIAEQILSASDACSVRQYPDSCPDPYGLIETYTRNLEDASANASKPTSESVSAALPWLSSILALVGIAMFGFAFSALRSTNIKPEDKESKYEASPTDVVKEVPAALSVVSMQDHVRSFKETIKNLGKETKEVAPEDISSGAYDAPPAANEEQSVKKHERIQMNFNYSSEDESQGSPAENVADNSEAANAMLAAKGLEQDKSPNRKKSRMGRFSKGLFGSKK